MKKGLLITGVIILIFGILSLSYAALNLFGYSHTLDGSAALYGRMHQRAIVFSVIGFALAAIGIACLAIRAKR